MSSLKISLIGAVALAAVHVAQAHAAEERPASKPNIIVIVADDLGYGDPGFQGGKEVPTPNIDGIAANGIRFTDGYVTGVVCSPTRAGLLTGRYQQRFGHEFNPGGVDQTNGTELGLPLSESTTAEALKKAGYKTALIGKWHLGSSEKFRPNQRGFDEFYGFLGGAHRYVPSRSSSARTGPILRNNEEVDAPAHLTEAFGKEAAQFVKREKGHPYFLLLTFNAVHTPLQPSAEHLARFEKISDPKRRAYAGLLSGMDDAIGELLAAVRETGEEENTLIFFLSDNGGPQKANGSNNAPLTGDKGSVREGGIRVPFAMQWKGTIPAGSVYKQPVISLDISATTAAVAGATLGSSDRPVDGVNLLPYLLGENKSAPHDALYWRAGRQHAIRRGNFKLRQQADEAPQLFDVVVDVAEQNDLAKERPELVEQLSTDYGAWNSELVEPLWTGRQGERKNVAPRRVRRDGRAKNKTGAEATKSISVN
jgi:arylsulfatase A-like enzyme